jgi:hypothetical protein
VDETSAAPNSTAETSTAEPTAGASENQTPAELPIEDARAYGVDGFDPDDPWNAVLWLESDRAITALPLTPRSLDQIVASLTEVRDAQRLALGMGAADTGDDGRSRSRGMLGGLSHAARVATGSAPVSRLWQSSSRGRWVIIGGAIGFVVLGVIASLLTG